MQGAVHFDPCPHFENPSPYLGSFVQETPVVFGCPASEVCERCSLEGVVIYGFVKLSLRVLS